MASFTMVARAPHAVATHTCRSGPALPLQRARHPRVCGLEEVRPAGERSALVKFLEPLLGRAAMRRRPIGGVLAAAASKVAPRPARLRI